MAYNYKKFKLIKNQKLRINYELIDFCIFALNQQILINQSVKSIDLYDVLLYAKLTRVFLRTSTKYLYLIHKSQIRQAVFGGFTKFFPPCKKYSLNIDRACRSTPFSSNSEIFLLTSIFEKHFPITK